MGVHSDQLNPKPFKRPKGEKKEDVDIRLRANKSKKRGLKTMGSLKKLTATGGIQPKAEAALRDNRASINKFIDDLLFG